jgi:hypothetical protein
MIKKRFQRKFENFVCENCGLSVRGDGYTNHCPKCLWSKHVDVMPGDRAETCHGMMIPKGILNENSEHIIVHKCRKCKKVHKTKSREEDNQEVIISISKNPVSL